MLEIDAVSACFGGCRFVSVKPCLTLAKVRRKPSWKTKLLRFSQPQRLYFKRCAYVCCGGATRSGKGLLLVVTANDDQAKSFFDSQKHRTKMYVVLLKTFAPVKESKHTRALLWQLEVENKNKKNTVFAKALRNEAALDQHNTARHEANREVV